MTGQLFATGTSDPTGGYRHGAAEEDADFLLAPAAERHAAGNRLRRSGRPVQPIRLRSGGTGYLVIDHDVARRALSDPRLLGLTGRVGAGRQLPGDVDRGMNTHMLNLAPPDHTRLRRLIAPVFTRRRVEDLRPRVAQVTAELLDAVDPSDEVDLIAALALPLPMRVLTGMLGVPDSDTHCFHAWTAALTAGSLPRHRLEATATTMLGYVRGLLEQKRARPGEDVLSALIEARDGTDRLTDDELTSMVFLLVIAGHETTVNLIGNGVFDLLTHPDQLHRVRAAPQGLPAAIEEFLRYDTPVQAAMRVSTEDLDLGGVHVPAGSTVVVSLLAANRDPARFPDPDTLDVARADNPQLAFGHGIHHCLGAPLARMEGAVAIGELLARHPAITLAAPPDQLAWRASIVMHGVERLPVRLH